MRRPAFGRSRRLARLALLAALWPGLPARGEDGPPLDAAAFDALTVGKTMDTATVAGVYGVETFLPQRRVIWRDAGRCVRGRWQQVQEMICFTYDDRPDHPVCWTYFDKGDRILGWFEGDANLSAPITLTPGNGPVSCDGYLGA